MDIDLILRALQFRGGLLVVVLGKIVQCVMIVLQQLGIFTQPHGNNIKDAALQITARLLVEYRNFQVLFELKITTIGLHLARDDFQQGGFSSTVAPQQTQALAGFDGDTDTF